MCVKIISEKSGSINRGGNRRTCLFSKKSNVSGLKRVFAYIRGLKRVFAHIRGLKRVFTYIRGFKHVCLYTWS